MMQSEPFLHTTFVQSHPHNFMYCNVLQYGYKGT
jgi:hypothetical protein